MEARQHGFTLVEMLVAISILSLIAVLGWRGLDGIMRTRAALDERSEKTRSLQLTFAQLDRDCAQLAPATLLGERPNLLVTEDALLLVRLVTEEQMPTRMQVVAYRLRNGTLTRSASLPTRDLSLVEAAWRIATVDDASEIMSVVALQNDVAEIRFRAWNSKEQAWQAADPSKAAIEGDGWPGLEIALQLQREGAPFIKSFFLGAA